MLGYLIGDLAGSPFRRFNKFELGENFQFFSPYVFIMGRHAEGSRETRFSEITTEVEPSQAFLVSSAMSRFMFDTVNHRERRTDPVFMRDALEGFADDYGVEFPFDARFLPSAAVVLMYSSRDREEMLSMVDTLCDCSEVSESDRNAVRMFADGLWAVNHGTLEDMDKVLKRGYEAYSELGLSSEELRRRGSSLQVQDLYIGEERPEVSISRDLTLSVAAGFKAAIEGTSFEDILRRAISYGGDTPVVCAVAGALADCRFRGVESDESMSRLEVLSAGFVPRDFVKTLETFEGKNMGSARQLLADVQKNDLAFGKQHEAASESNMNDLGYNQMFFEPGREVKSLPYPRVQVLCGKDGSRKYYIPAWDERTESQFRGIEVPGAFASPSNETKLYVSYYGSKSRPKDAFLVQISNDRPKGVDVDVEFESVYPGDIVKQHKEGALDDAGYIDAYGKSLESNKEKILSAVKEIKDMAHSEGKDVYFLCYEKPGDFCHRYLLNNFLVENGIRCEENPAEAAQYLFGAVQVKEFASPDEKVSPVRTSYDAFVARIKARFGEDNVVIGGDIHKDFQAAYKAWQRPGETYLDGQAPEILDRYYVFDASVRERNEAGKLVYSRKDSVLPVWALDKQYYRNGDIAGLLEWKAWKDYGTVAEARRQLTQAKEDLGVMIPNKDWSSYFMQKDLVSSLELSVIALEKGKGFADYVLSCFDKYGTSARANEVMNGIVSVFNHYNSLLEFKKSFMDIYSRKAEPVSRRVEDILEASKDNPAARAFVQRHIYRKESQTSSKERQLDDMYRALDAMVEKSVAGLSSILGPVIGKRVEFSEDAGFRKEIFRDYYYPAKDAATVLSAAERRMPFCVRRAVESKAVLDEVRTHIEYGLFDAFVRNPSDENGKSYIDFKKLPAFDELRACTSSIGKAYIGSNESSLGPDSFCSPVLATDYLGIRNGDDLVGSVEISALTGNLVFNRRVDEGVIQNYGHLSASPMQADYSKQRKNSEWAPVHYAGQNEKASDLCRQFDSIVFDDRYFGDIKEERDKYEEESGRGSHYAKELKNNLNKLAFSFETSEDPNLVRLRDNIERIRTIRASEYHVKM